MTPEQCRMARNLLDWSLGDLGQRSGADHAVVAGFESGRGVPSGSVVARLRQTFEAVGVEFVEWGAGVRLS